MPAVLAADLAGRPAWGERPTLYLMEMADGRCQLDPLDIPARAWHSLPLHNVIAATAAGIRRANIGPADPAFIGTAVRFEDWDLPWPLLTGAALHQACSDLTAGAIHARHDRIETRLILAAGRDGTSWLARQHRHSPSPRVITSVPGEAPAPGIPPRLGRHPPPHPNCPRTRARPPGARDREHLRPTRQRRQRKQPPGTAPRPASRSA